MYNFLLEWVFKNSQASLLRESTKTQWRAKEAGSCLPTRCLLPKALQLLWVRCRSLCESVLGKGACHSLVHPRLKDKAPLLS